MSLPQGDKLTDASVVIDDDHSVRIIDTTDTVIDSSLSFYGFTPVSDLPLPQPCNVHYKYFIDNAEVLQESAVMSSPYSKIFTRSSSKLKGIIDSSFYDSSVGMEVSTNSGKFLTLEYRGSRTAGIDASIAFAATYMGTENEYQSPGLIFQVGLRGDGTSLLTFGTTIGSYGLRPWRLLGPFPKNTPILIDGTKYPAYGPVTFTQEDLTDAGADNITIEQMTFVLFNLSGVLITNASVDYEIRVNNASYADTNLPVNQSGNPSSLDWIPINNITANLGDSLTIMFSIKFT